MAIGQRKRSGGASKRGGGRGNTANIDLINGLRGLSGLAGNQALVALLARKPGQAAHLHEPADLDGDTYDPSAQEEMLAKLRLLLDDAEKLPHDKDPRKLLAALKERILLLIAVLHGALDQAEGYDGGLLEELDRLKHIDDDPGEHRVETMLELLHALVRHGEGLHKALAGQLPGPGAEGHPPQIDKSLVHKLKHEVRELHDRAKSDRPPKKHAHADAGAAALEGLPLGKKKKQGR